MKNPFRWNFEKGVWMFGTNNFTDIIGGAVTLLALIVSMPYFFLKNQIGKLRGGDLYKGIEEKE